MAQHTTYETPAVSALTCEIRDDNTEIEICRILEAAIADLSIADNVYAIQWAGDYRALEQILEGPADLAQGGIKGGVTAMLQALLDRCFKAKRVMSDWARCGRELHRISLCCAGIVGSAN